MTNLFWYSRETQKKNYSEYVNRRISIKLLRREKIALTLILRSRAIKNPSESKRLILQKVQLAKNINLYSFKNPRNI